MGAGEGGEEIALVLQRQLFVRVKNTSNHKITVRTGLRRRLLLLRLGRRRHRRRGALRRREVALGGRRRRVADLLCHARRRQARADTDADARGGDAATAGTLRERRRRRRGTVGVGGARHGELFVELRRRRVVSDVVEEGVVSAVGVVDLVLASAEGLPEVSTASVETYFGNQTRCSSCDAMFTNVQHVYNKGALF